MTTPYDTYRQLMARVEAFGQAVRERYAAHLTCHAGCDHCCYQDFTVFPVEVHHLAQAVAALTVDERQQLQQHLQQAREETLFLLMADTPQPCALLRDGRCSLYAGRPLICRMQGYPLYSTMIERPDESQRDCCPLNFSTMALADVDSASIYNLDLVNQTLAAINHLFVQETGQPDERVSLRQAVCDALAMLSDEADAPL